MSKFPGGSGGDESPPGLRGLVAAWFPDGGTAETLADGGFSGSPVFLVRPVGHFPHVLKAFAAGTNRSRAEWIHRIIHHLRATYARAVIPGVLETVDGGTVVESAGGRLWEMAAYVDGAAVNAPSCHQIAAAMRAVARVHGALGMVPGEPSGPAASMGLASRIDRARLLLERPWSKLRHTASRTSPWSVPVGAALARACDILDEHQAESVLRRLAAVVPDPLPCQVVLRDLWSDHVLFDRRSTDRVAGIVDFHAMGVDTPAMDVARLLGSWLPPHAPAASGWWDAAIDAYVTERSLGERERRLVPLLAATGIVFGLDNWFRWTLVEERTFPDGKRVLSRIDRLVTCLPEALNVLAATASNAGLTLKNSSP